jgi:hypothetical protein
VNEAQAQALRAPFAEEQIGKLPRVTCKDCTENKRDKHCARHERKKCDVCKAYISTAHIHLDYCGHAATTDRLLQVDPEWTWEPMARGENGEPLMTNGGLWIHLTVAGVTRPGFGDGASMKEVIGDAIRNAAMRFGVALDLWAKEDLRGDNAAAEDGSRGPAGRVQSRSASDSAPASSFEVPEAAKAASEARDLTPATAAERKKLKALAAKVVAEGKATDTQLDSAMIQAAQQSFEAALENPKLAKSVVADFTKRLGNLDRNAEKAQQEVAA